MNGKKVAEAKAVKGLRDALIRAYSQEQVGVENKKEMEDLVREKVNAMPESQLRVNAENAILKKILDVDVIRLAKIFNIVNRVDDEPIELLRKASRT